MGHDTQPTTWKNPAVDPAPPPEDSVALPQDEVDQLQQARVSHAVIDQATGIVMALGRIPPDQAGSVLQEVSQHTHLTLRCLAEALTAWAHTGEIDLTIRLTLEQALHRQTPHSRGDQVRASRG
ncbi:ANTAR domain-containing protein [Streptomyces sp. CA-135486]|uniref:ANTAR domain-containing protein n=1 Tax=Streptomyces sp. CA-135486 TaxID=3240049 RepID=UPI003D8D75F5